MCFSDDILKDVCPFYLVSMPEGVNVMESLSSITVDLVRGTDVTKSTNALTHNFVTM